MFTFIIALCKRRPMRTFALLDAQGICRALRNSRTSPATGNWVEVGECRLAWLHRPLPADARRASAPPRLRTVPA